MTAPNSTQTLPPASSATPARRAPRPTVTPEAADCRPTEGTAPAAVPAPYSCTCGASDPYRGKRPVKKGGHGCRKCAAVERQIHDAQMASYREIAAAAYRNGCRGEEKSAILARAVEVSSKVWRDVQIAFGIDLGREDRLAMAAAMTDAGNALLDQAQDVALAGSVVAA